MYLEYFGLDDYPFDGLPDRRFYYVGGSQHQALGLLNTALSRTGSICVLTGPSGSGKTTLVRMLMRSLPRRMRIISIDDPRIDPQTLLATILRASGVVATSFESIPDLTMKVRHMLELSIANGIITTVICDEAQSMSDATLEQVRLISNLEGEAGKMINFLLVGREDFVERLNAPEQEVFKSRVKVFTELPCLKEPEVAAYITYRLQQVSRVKPIFTNKAITLITKKSGGAPRLVNAIADMCLTLACQKKIEQVNAKIARRAAHMVQHNEVGFKTYFKNLLHEIFSISLYGKVLVVGAAALCAAGAFVGALSLMKTIYPVQTLEGALISDREVQERYLKVTDYLFRGRSAEGRELYYFNQAISQAYFKADAYATLLKLHGYAIAEEDGVISDPLLQEVDLQRFEQNGPLAEAMSYNCPVLISLVDDNLTPFYVVLYNINDDVGQLIVGDYLFAVKLSYIQERYCGTYTILHPYVGDVAALSSNRTDTRKNMENRLRPYLAKYRQRALESAEREKNLASLNVTRQKSDLKRIRNDLYESISAQLKAQKVPEADFDRELNRELELAVESSADYQNATNLLRQYEQTYEQKMDEAADIRSISMRLDDGYTRGMNLFLMDQHLSEVNGRAIALLTLTSSDGPRLLNALDNVNVEGTAVSGTEVDGDNSTAAQTSASVPGANKSAPAANAIKVDVDSKRGK